MPPWMTLIIGVILGSVVAFIFYRFYLDRYLKNSTAESDKIVADANQKAETIIRAANLEAKDEALKIRQQSEAENRERMKEVRAAETRLQQREESLDRRVESLDKREHQISSLQGQVERRERDVAASEGLITKRLEEVAGMTSDEAKAELLTNLKDQVTHESAAIIREAELRTKAEADKTAREILSLAIQRVAADHSAESTV